ncbi:hypothetical protein P7K49_037590 [Saguinus oedipus]|uniref:Uncharacterized protein n=1 Tax=Saguinus oedipus TaxID=9490 RepID=A0ABQ9TIG5_SAGOE|nr:hypothetical protein P7K49_037590 [Saguinus oedipus]
MGPQSLGPGGANLKGRKAPRLPPPHCPFDFAGATCATSASQLFLIRCSPLSHSASVAKPTGQDRLFPPVVASRPAATTATTTTGTTLALSVAPCHGMGHSSPAGRLLPSQARGWGVEGSWATSLSSAGDLHLTVGPPARATHATQRTGFSTARQVLRRPESLIGLTRVSGFHRDGMEP